METHIRTLTQNGVQLWRHTYAPLRKLVCDCRHTCAPLRKMVCVWRHTYAPSRMLSLTHAHLLLWCCDRHKAAHTCAYTCIRKHTCRHDTRSTATAHSRCHTFCHYTHSATEHSHIVTTHHGCVKVHVMTGWRRLIGCVIFLGHFLQKRHILSDSLAKNDLQLKASYASSPPCTARKECVRYV